MSRMLRALLLFCALLAVVSSALSQQEKRDLHFVESDTLLLFTPSEDNSGFGGKWKLAYDVPRFLASYCRQKFQTGVVGPLAVADLDTSNGITAKERISSASLRLYSSTFRARYIIISSIESFSVTRFIIAEQTLAGYEAFAAEISMKFQLYDAASIGGEGENPPFLYDGEALGKVKDKGLGITLLGKQTTRTNQYYSLDELNFGGEQFNKTIIGEAMLKCAEDFSAKLEKAIPLLKAKTTILPSNLQIDSTGADTTVRLTRRIVRGEIILVDGDEVFLNLGSEEHLQTGDVFPVFIEGKPIRDPKTGDILGTNDERIGEVQVIEIRAAHLSLATILKGKGVIKPRDQVRVLIVR